MNNFFYKRIAGAVHLDSGRDSYHSNDETGTAQWISLRMDGWTWGMTFDLLMIMLIYFGFSTYLNLPAVQQVMWLIGCLFLLYLSIDSFKESRRKKRDGRRAELPLHKKNPICPVCWLLFPLPILCSGLAYSGPCLPLPSSNPRLRSVS